MGEVIETRGRFRVVVEPDTDPQRPDGDYFGTVLYVDGRRCEVVGSGYGVDTADIARGVSASWERFRDMALVERYLRMWCEAAGFDYFDTRDGAYVNVVTPADLKLWGFDDVDAYRQATGHDDPSHGNLTEWQAYVDGDVYGVIIEKLVSWTTEDADVPDRDTWEEVQAVWGYYGNEYAEESAREALDQYAPAATCRHCERFIVLDEGRWIDPEATGDDAIWRETCDSHETFTAEHEPTDDDAQTD